MPRQLFVQFQFKRNFGCLVVLQLFDSVVLLVALILSVVLKMLSRCVIFCPSVWNKILLYSYIQKHSEPDP